MCARAGTCDRRRSCKARSTRLRRTSRGVGSILLVVTPMLFSACAKDNVTTPRTYALTGRVRLVGALRNAAGDSIDIQRIENADSVGVYLYHGSTLEDSTRALPVGTASAV